MPSDKRNKGQLSLTFIHVHLLFIGTDRSGPIDLDRAIWTERAVSGRLKPVAFEGTAERNSAEV